MNLNPREKDKLLISVAAMVARGGLLRRGGGHAIACHIRSFPRCRAMRAELRKIRVDARMLRLIWSLLTNC